VIGPATFSVDNRSNAGNVAGRDFWHYGVEAKRKELKLVMTYTHEQGLVKQKRKFEGLLNPSTV